MSTRHEKKKTDREPRPFRSRAIDGEILAIIPSALDAVYEVEHDQDRPTQVLDGGIAVVQIEGPLEHHASWWFDSYDAVVKRVEDSLKDSNVKVIVLKIDSGGGDASGNSEASKKLRRLSAKYGKKIYAYSDEAAYSAAYGLACGAEEIWLPRTGGVGSVGVIATTLDRTKANEKSGYVVELLTSGKRKADGHPDRPMTDDIRSVIQSRVDDLAHEFFKLVANARHTTPEAVAELEAGVFLGKRAVKAGLADGVASWDDFCEMVLASIESLRRRLRGRPRHILRVALEPTQEPPRRVLVEHRARVDSAESFPLLENGSLRWVHSHRHACLSRPVGGSRFDHDLSFTG